MPRGAGAPPAAGTQDVRFCRALDGVRIAYAVHGSGPPLVVNTCWLSLLVPDHVPSPAGALAEPLSRREVEVLQLAAEGLDNAAVAERLTLSVRTVERHLSNAYIKLGLTGRTARAAAVAHVLRR